MPQVRGHNYDLLLRFILPREVQPRLIPGQSLKALGLMVRASLLRHPLGLQSSCYQFGALSLQDGRFP